jgi:predicted RNA-binding Zn ribbon-like protein
LSLPKVAASRIGGDVAVDFFNTVDWRLDPGRRSERLLSYEHVLAWMAQVALVTDDEVRSLANLARTDPDGAAADHAAILDLREQTYDALVADSEPSTLQNELVLAHLASRLVRSDGSGWTWYQPELTLQTPRHRLALELARMMTMPKAARFHRCEDQFCGWVFLDTSRQHNRRWCSAADCGNRNRARMHYARRTSPEQS